MSKTAFIIHGTGGNPESNWFPWLKRELEKLNFTVFVPKFPTPTNQSLENWLKIFEKYFSFIDKETIFIGHSLGPAFILSLLEKLNKPIKASFFVAGFTGKLNNSYFDHLNQSFSDKTFNWAKIRKNCKKFYVINSDNDPYVPLEKGEELAKNLHTKLVLLKNSGHINSESGFTSFEFLLSKIKKEI